VLAQNPAQGTVLMPYSLFGNFTTARVVTGGQSCTVNFAANATGAVWTERCGADALSPQTEKVISLSAPSVVACGQNQQLGMSYGVFGGILTGSVNAGGVPACVYFTRVDAQHQYGNSQNAFANLTVYTPTDFNGTVSCQATYPGNGALAPNTQFRLTNYYLCSSGVCEKVVQSSYCTDGSLHSVYQIGIGMGIGGIGLLLITFALIFVISSLVQG
jgi:hypothetical protein